MSKFSQLLENAFNTNKLKRVRLKIDPAFCEKGEISKFQGYEGYILAEKDGHFKIYFECMGGQIAMIPQNMVDVPQSLSKLERLKIATVKYLKNQLGKQTDDVLYQMVCNSPNLETLEAFLLNNGCTERDLLEIYRIDYYEEI